MNWGQTKLRLTVNNKSIHTSNYSFDKSSEGREEKESKEIGRLARPDQNRVADSHKNFKRIGYE